MSTDIPCWNCGIGIDTLRHLKCPDCDADIYEDPKYYNNPPSTYSERLTEQMLNVANFLIHTDASGNRYTIDEIGNINYLPTYVVGIDPYRLDNGIVYTTGSNTINLVDNTQPDDPIPDLPF